YCLNTGNIDVSPHFTTLLHSVVRLRPGFVEGRDDFENYPQRALVDAIVIWTDDPDPPVPEGFALVFRQSQLKVLRRTEDRSPGPPVSPKAQGTPREIHVPD